MFALFGFSLDRSENSINKLYSMYNIPIFQTRAVIAAYANRYLCGNKINLGFITDADYIFTFF